MEPRSRYWASWQVAVLQQMAGSLSYSWGAQEVSLTMQEVTPTVGPSFKGLAEETRTTWF